MTNSTTFPGTVTATGFTGTSTNATNAVLATDATDASRPVIFGTGTTGNVPLKTDPGLVYNPSSNKLTAGAFVGNGSELTNLPGFDPDVDIIAIGNGAGTTQQGASAIAIGHDAGSSGTQGAQSVAIGQSAGQVSQGTYATAMGFEAGKTNQGQSSTAIGVTAGVNAQGASATAVGQNAGSASQGANATAIGVSAGSNAQGAQSVAVGYFAGLASQGANSVAVGRDSGSNAQGTQSTAVGYLAGNASQGAYGTAIGDQAGLNAQGGSSTAVGRGAGRNNQGGSSVAIGHDAGLNSQGGTAVAIGVAAGTNSQGAHATAVGRNAGTNSQAAYSVAIGYDAARNSQQGQSTAVGNNAGCISQGAAATALGVNAGRGSQGQSGLALGINAAISSSEASSIYMQQPRSNTGGFYLKWNNTGEVCIHNSDDRIKDGETLITRAVETLSKLIPQNYFKRQKLDPYAPEQTWNLESGLMAQEIYYNAPEMRHLVNVPPEAGDIDNFTPPPSDDPSQDPDYSVWGDGIASVDYLQMVPYLVKGVQEIVTELPRSKTTVSNTWGQNISGLVVSANTNKHKTNTVPMVNLSNVSMDKSWYGVVSNEKTDSIDYDTIVDTKGDSRIWVTDLGGALESGDLVTTSNVAPGYAQKQEGGALMNYTVAKVTQDCDFTEPLQISIKIPKRELSNVSYYIHDASREIDINQYQKRSSLKTRVEETPIYFKEAADGNEMRYYQGDMEIGNLKHMFLPDDANKSIKTFSEISVEEYNALDAETKATYSLGTSKKYIQPAFSKSKMKIPQHDEVRIIEELVDVLDENGQTVWEETSNTVPVYTLVDHGTYKAALLTCKLY